LLIKQKLAVENGKYDSLSILPHYLWQKLSGEKKERTLSPLDVAGVLGNDQLTHLRKVIEAKGVLLFPFWHLEHWMVAIVDFGNRKFLVAEGKYWTVPVNLRRLLFSFLKSVASDAMEGFPPMARMKCPIQVDSHSCGIVALSVLQGFCVNDKEEDQWSQDAHHGYRLLWLERLLKHHDPNLQFDVESSAAQRFLQQHLRSLSTGAKAPGPEPERSRSHQNHHCGELAKLWDEIQVDSEDLQEESISDLRTGPDSPDLDFIQSNPHVNDATNDYIQPDCHPYPELRDLYSHGVNYPQPPVLASLTNDRNYRHDPLPYSMDPIEPGQKQCQFCGPPWNILPIQDLVDQQPCTMACGKRYFVEVYAKPTGCNLTHRQSERETHGRGRYSKFTLN
jgi:hypothetical protein